MMGKPGLRLAGGGRDGGRRCGWDLGFPEKAHLCVSFVVQREESRLAKRVLDGAFWKDPKTKIKN